MAINIRRDTIKPEEWTAYTFKKSDAAIMVEVLHEHYVREQGPGEIDRWLKSRHRTSKKVEYRQMLMYFMSMIREFSWNEMLQWTGYVNHTSAIHGRHVIEGMISIYPAYRERVRGIYDIIMKRSMANGQ